MDGSGQIMGTVSLVFKAITSTGNNESGRNSLILWMRLRGRVQEILWGWRGSSYRFWRGDDDSRVLG